MVLLALTVLQYNGIKHTDDVTVEYDERVTEVTLAEVKYKDS